MADMSLSGQTDVALALSKKRIDAEIAARELYPDQMLTAIIEKAQELHGREIDLADVRAVLSAKAALNPVL